MYKLLLLPYLLLEIFVCVIFVLSFGFGTFLICLILSLFLGIVLLAVFWQNMLSFRIMALKDLFRNFSFVIAAFLFIIPGILSSILAVCVCIFALVFSKKTKNDTYDEYANRYDEEIIDVEIVEDSRR